MCVCKNKSKFFLVVLTLTAWLSFNQCCYCDALTSSSPDGILLNSGGVASSSIPSSDPSTGSSSGGDITPDGESSSWWSSLTPEAQIGLGVAGALVVGGVVALAAGSGGGGGGGSGGSSVAATTTYNNQILTPRADIQRVGGVIQEKTIDFGLSPVSHTVINSQQIRMELNAQRISSLQRHVVLQTKSELKYQEDRAAHGGYFTIVGDAFENLATLPKVVGSLLIPNAPFAVPTNNNDLQIYYVVSIAHIAQVTLYAVYNINNPIIALDDVNDCKDRNTFIAALGRYGVNNDDVKIFEDFMDQGIVDTN